MVFEQGQQGCPTDSRPRIGQQRAQRSGILQHPQSLPSAVEHRGICLASQGFEQGGNGRSGRGRWHATQRLDRFEAQTGFAIGQQRHDGNGQGIGCLTGRASVGHDPHRLEAQVQGRLGVGGLTFEPSIACRIAFGDAAQGPGSPGLPALG